MSIRRLIFGPAIMVALVAAAIGGLIFLGELTQASHVPIPTMAVDTVTTGNTYTADPDLDTNNQDNTLVVGAIDACRLVAMPTLGGIGTSVGIQVVVKNAPNAIFLDARLT